MNIAVAKLYMNMMPECPVVSGMLYGMETCGLFCSAQDHEGRVDFVADRLRDLTPDAYHAFVGLLRADFEAKFPDMTALKGIPIQVCHTRLGDKDHTLIYANGTPVASDIGSGYYADFEPIADALGVELDFENYLKTEETLAEKLREYGIRAHFIDGESDSFGPLSRVCVMYHIPFETIVHACYG